MATTETGFHFEWENASCTHSDIYTPGSVFNIEDMMLSLSVDKVLLIKAQAAKVASSPSCKGMMSLLGLKNFTNMA